MKLSICYFLLFFLSTPLLSQDTTFIDRLKLPPIIDTLFIDHDRNNLSLRIFTNYKDNRFRLTNPDEKILYAPHNPIGIGFGIGTRKILLDVAFNIKSKDIEPTERFDLQGSLVLDNHYTDFILQTYHGYEPRHETAEEFRADINSFSTRLAYMYIFDASEYSMAAIKSGLARQKKPAFTSGLGGFLFLNQISADSSIVPRELYPNFNEEARITKLLGVGAGLLANISASVPFLRNLFASASITPGIGLMYKNVETESVSYRPESAFLYILDLGGILGYNGNKFYTSFYFGYGLTGTSLDFNNWILYNSANAKLAFGYKIAKK